MRVLFFGQLKDITGSSEDSPELGEGASLESVFEHYASRFPRLRDLRSSIVIARNHQFSVASTPVSDGDEIAFLPPVSGGGFRQLLRIDSRSDRRRFRSRSGTHAGGWGRGCFRRRCRNNTKGRSTLFLDYECYEPMAIRTMRDSAKRLRLLIRLPASLWSTGWGAWRSARSVY